MRCLVRTVAAQQNPMVHSGQAVRPARGPAEKVQSPRAGPPKPSGDAGALKQVNRKRTVAPGRTCKITMLLLCRPEPPLSAFIRIAVTPSGIHIPGRYRTALSPSSSLLNVTTLRVLDQYFWPRSSASPNASCPRLAAACRGRANAETAQWWCKRVRRRLPQHAPSAMTLTALSDQIIHRSGHSLQRAACTKTPMSMRPCK